MQFNNEATWIPELGLEFQTEEEAWQFWKSYSGRMGFNVRKHYGHKSRVDGLTTSMNYVCSNEGIRKKDKRDEQTKNSRAETRTSCKVCLGIKFIRETNRFKVTNFISDHNHYLQKPEACYLLPSQRVVPEAAGYDIELADESGIMPKKSHVLMGRQVGGPAHLPFTITDHRNALRNKRQWALISGEAVAMLNYFHERVLENPSFQHVEQVDETQEITNIFWADARMIADYARFGEVIVFDTTFGTNREQRPFGVFVGFNHFKEMVILGATIMYDQTVDSFEWVFKTFLEVHNHKKPKTIFTDQDIAMGIAIGKVMPETTHGLCTWHIMENACTHLMRHNTDGMNILGEFRDCMYVYEEVAEFDKAFGDLVEKIKEETWLPFIYKFKEKWAYCYMKNAVTLGIRSTQLSESINKDLKCYLKSDLSIIRLLKHFESIVNEKRDKEIVSDYGWRRKQPKMKVNVPILRQAGSLYTPKIFELFQIEYELSMSAQIEGPFDNEYKVAISDFGKHESSHKCHKVLWDETHFTGSCGCKKFERTGIQCWHALKVLDAMNIKVLPEKYIVKRWTMEAQDDIVEDRNGRVVVEDTRLDMARRNRDLCRKFSKISAKASYDEESAVFVDNALNALDKQLEERMKNPSSKVVDNPVSPLPTSVEDLTENPPQLKKKEGRKTNNSKRTRSWQENMKKTNKKITKVSKKQGAKVSNSIALAVKELPPIEYNYSPSYTELLTGCPNLLHSPYYFEAMPSNQVLSHHQRMPSK